MAIPDYQTIMLPLLRIAGDNSEHTMDEAVELLASQFKLSDEDRRATLSSGALTFDNRTGWARTYLKKAGLIEYAGKGRIRITKRGLQTLHENPSKIDVVYLKRFPEFLDFVRPLKHVGHRGKKAKGVEETGNTPEDILDTNYKYLRHGLAHDLLERTKKCSPRFFERLVLELLLKMGYGGSREDAEQVGRGSDGGIDGIIKEDRLGLDVVYVQAKRWQGSVGRPIVQAFAGSLEGHKARKGVLITTSTFTPDAREYVDRIEKRIVLIDGEQLAELMIDHGIAVTEVASYLVKKIDQDYFSSDGASAL